MFHAELNFLGWPHKSILENTCYNFYDLPVTSSGALKNGYVLDNIQSMITPHAHISTAVVWCSYFNKTSGGRNPGVPARAAFCDLRAQHLRQVNRILENQ